MSQQSCVIFIDGVQFSGAPIADDTRPHHVVMAITLPGFGSGFKGWWNHTISLLRRRKAIPIPVPVSVELWLQDSSPAPLIGTLSIR